MKDYKIVIVLIILSIVTGIIATCIFGQLYGAWTFNTPTSPTGYAKGFYDYNGFYCVVTKGRTITEINETETHEACHALIDQDYKHFCKKTR